MYAARALRFEGSEMALRFWPITFLAVVLAFATWAVLGLPRHVLPLRSEHSQPATVVPTEEVAVTSEGHLFHKPSCRYIHGKPQTMSAQEATQNGYAPDPRCMKEALVQAK
jgi:hypothetical protein